MPLPAALAGIGAAVGSVGAMVDKIAGLFTGPAARLFSNTLADISGVVGQSLNPVFRIFNSVARMVGDTIATVAPYVTDLFTQLETGFNSLRPIFSQIQSVLIGVGIGATQVVKAFWSIFGAFADTLGLSDRFGDLSNVIDVVAKGLIGLTQVFKVLFEQITKFAKGERLSGLNEIWRQVVADTNKLWAQAKTERRSSVGARQTSASYMDLDAVEKQVRQAAFSESMTVIEINKKQLRTQERIAVASEATASAIAGIGGAGGDAVGRAALLNEAFRTFRNILIPGFDAIFRPAAP